MTVGILLLAAGRGRRFGSDKRQALLNSGESLILAAITRLQETGLPFIVCLAPGDAVLRDNLRALGIDSMSCPNAARGMGATLADAVQQLPPWDGVLIALADMPVIRADTFQVVAANLGPADIHQPSHQGRRGHPVGFGRDFFPALARLDGDTGARHVLTAHPEHVQEIEVDDSGIYTDVDTPEQLAAIHAAP